ncbi:hypothetical protein N0V91_007393 [Didymella pomorum]|uniref:BTB domain-containing protein n=1 Tax=Didymella pomorum TaxID=749634 RepID=A0A9W9D4X3_9PLEO|nr:hypothetical protein N0V91_007393 [Didymella pomorum]
MATTHSNTLDSTEAGGSHTIELLTTLAANANAPTGLKRKLTDPELKFITIDQYHDLTLIVGNPDHVDGQKAFQISRSAMKHVSDIWTKMLAPGAWAESKQSEIEMPDDSCRAMLLELRVAHSQFAQLPNELTMGDLRALATLTDKYNLVEIVRVMLELKKWLDPYKQEWKKTIASSTHLTEFAEIHQVFGNQDAYEYIVNRLTVKDQVGDEGFSIKGAEGNESKLRSTLVERILTFYWKGLTEIGSDLKPYAPCDKTMGYGRGAHHSSCSFEACFGDFGFMEKAKETLKKALHADVWRQLQTAEYLQAVA